MKSYYHYPVAKKKKMKFKNKAYGYQDCFNIDRFEGAKLRIIPEMEYAVLYKPSMNDPFMAESIAEAFMKEPKESPGKADFDDFFQSKVELSEDSINLILNEIKGREGLKYNNLKRLYDDLLMIDNWRLERPYPFNYNQDRIWSDLNKSELKIHEQIRMELKDSARDIAFPSKELRHGLLEFKLQNQKSKMLDMSDLENEIGGVMEPDGSYKLKGDMHYQN